jgi:hypothetical protein
VILGSGVSLVECVDIAVYSGKLVIEGSYNYTGGGSPTFKIYGGTVELTGVLPSTRAIEVYGGTLYPNQESSSAAAITAYGGTVDFRQANRVRDHASVTRHWGANVYDPAGLGTSVYVEVGRAGAADDPGVLVRPAGTYTRT